MQQTGTMKIFEVKGKTEKQFQIGNTASYIM